MLSVHLLDGKTLNGPFNLQPLFQKGVEKWFQKSGWRNLVGEKWFFKIGSFFWFEKGG